MFDTPVIFKCMEITQNQKDYEYIKSRQELERGKKGREKAIEKEKIYNRQKIDTVETKH